MNKSTGIGPHRQLLINPPASPTAGAGNPLPSGTFTVVGSVTADPGATVVGTSAVLVVPTAGTPGFQRFPGTNGGTLTNYSFTFAGFTPALNQPLTLIIIALGSDDDETRLEIPFSFGPASATVNFTGITVDDQLGTTITGTVTNADTIKVTAGGFTTTQTFLSATAANSFTAQIAASAASVTVPVNVQPSLSGTLGNLVLFNYIRVSSTTPTAPTVTASGLDSVTHNISVQFSGPMDPISTMSPANYTLSIAGLSVTGVNLASGTATAPTAVSLVLSGIPAATFALTINPTGAINPVKNSAGTALASPTNLTITV